MKVCQLIPMFLLAIASFQAMANPCYVNETPLDGRISGIKLSRDAKLVTRFYGDGNHLNRMLLKSGHFTLGGVFICTDEQPRRCTMNDGDFMVLFDGAKMRMAFKKARLTVVNFASENRGGEAEFELMISRAASDGEIVLAPARPELCEKLMPFSDEIGGDYPEPVY